MKKTVLRYGLYATIFIVIFFLVTWLWLGSSETPDFKTQEIVGYAGIIGTMVFVFLGMKYYRDKVNGGVLAFGKAMQLGLLITLLPAVAFGLFDILYVMFVDPGFTEKYYTYMLAEMKQSLPAAEYASKLKDVEKQKDLFSNPVIHFFIMFLTVFLIGLIVTVISSFILKRGKSTVV